MPSNLRRFDVAGHAHFWTISCYNRLSFFWINSVKQAAVDGLKRLRDVHGICLLAYVIMPEHLHVLLYPQRRGSNEPIPVSTLLEDFKAHAGMDGKEALRCYWRDHGRLWSQPLNDWARGELRTQEFWTTRGHDFNVYERAKVLEKVEYCHNNPVKRGLVRRPIDWRWSSFRFYEVSDRSLLPMDWDGRWPIDW